MILVTTHRSDREQRAIAFLASVPACEKPLRLCGLGDAGRVKAPPYLRIGRGIDLLDHREEGQISDLILRIAKSDKDVRHSAARGVERRLPWWRLEGPACHVILNFAVACWNWLMPSDRWNSTNALPAERKNTATLGLSAYELRLLLSNHASPMGLGPLSVGYCGSKSWQAASWR
jgi:hypothetical protein